MSIAQREALAREILEAAIAKVQRLGFTVKVSSSTRGPRGNQTHSPVLTPKSLIFYHPRKGM